MLCVDNISSSIEIITLISDMIDHEAVSEYVNAYYLISTSPYDKTIGKCLFCDKSLEEIGLITKKGQFSNKQLAKDSSTTV